MKKMKCTNRDQFRARQRKYTPKVKNRIPPAYIYIIEDRLGFLTLFGILVKRWKPFVTVIAIVLIEIKLINPAAIYKIPIIKNDQSIAINTLQNYQI